MPVKPIATFRTFETRSDALSYRKEEGTGGWVFAAADGFAILFPPQMTAQDVFCHAFTRGLSGELVR